MGGCGRGGRDVKPVGRGRREGREERGKELWVNGGRLRSVGAFGVVNCANAGTASVN